MVPTAPLRGQRRTHPALISCGIFLCALLYVSSFWGRAAHILPAPLDQWSYLYYRLIGPQWNAGLAGILPDDQRHQLYVVVEAYVLGLVVPVLALWLFRRRLTSVGLDRPNVLGLRFIGLDLLFSIPFGFFLLAMMGSDFSDPRQLLVKVLLMVPEHFLICGVFVALLLPERQLPCPVSMAAVDGPWWRRALRWIGLAQEASPGGNVFLAWFGLTRHSLLAIVGSGVLFATAHVGKQHTLELLLSFPVGLLFAYLTVRSHSILPSLVTHWSLNLAPLALMAML